MRFRLLLSCVLLLLAFLSPALLHAQFQAPAPEELKMTADPKAPGADAVYLDMQEIDNDSLHYQSSYVRIKVLTEKGKRLATVEVPYLKHRFQITDIKGRTIHPDGAIIPLTVKPEDLLIASNQDRQVQKKVFTLPSVEVGSILEFTYTLRYDDDTFSSPAWNVQQPYFVHKAHYEFTPFKAFMPGSQNVTSMYLVDEHGNPVNTLIWWGKLPEGVKVQQSAASGKYSVDVTDVPAIPDEEWTPPLNTLVYQVNFYYKNARSPEEFWITEAKRWSKDADHFADPSNAIREAVASLVAPGDSNLVKAQKLYAAVQGLENTDYTRQKSAAERKQLKLKVARRAEDTWTQKSGDSEDIALLYLSMLRAAGLTAYAAKVVDRSRSIFDPSYMRIGQLDDTLVILQDGGKEIFLDPGEKLCPFETVNWRHAEVRGLREGPQGNAIVATPPLPYAANTTTRTGDINLDARGNFTGYLRFIFHGQQALYWRQASLKMDNTELKKKFDQEDLEELMPAGTEGHVDHFLGMDSPDGNLIAMINVKGNIGTATAKRLILPAFFLETRGHVPFVKEEKRQEPVDMRFGSVITDEVTYHLPAGMAVEGVPQDVKTSWAGHALYIVKSKTDTNQITIARSVARAFTLLKPEAYADLRGFYSKVAAGDQAQLVLKAAPAAPEVGDKQ